MTASSERTVLRLALVNPQTLEDVGHWAAVAELIGMPPESAISLSGVTQELSVHNGLVQVPFPVSKEDDDA